MSEYIIREYDYAIRIVAYLAGLNGKTKVDEISENLFLNKPMVNKIVFQLKKCGIILTKTGKNGGILLNPDYTDLSFMTY
jgi:Rrf2 family nitric oxide-sensitive transcriptional repressor